MNVVVCCVGLGGWYPRGVARLIHSLGEYSPGVTVAAWVNCIPFGAPRLVCENGYDYTAYCAKPFALMSAQLNGADIAILVDAAFYAVRPISPLIDHIQQTGYYFCRNGNNVGEWSSDRCLERMGVDREEAFAFEEISSYCVGLNMNDGRCLELLQRWCGFASDRLTIPGPHSALYNGTGRNPGFVSKHPRVMGHRHDQTVLSVLAHRMGLQELVNRPKFTAYSGSETEETVLVNRGGSW